MAVNRGKEKRVVETGRPPRTKTVWQRITSRRRDGKSAIGPTGRKLSARTASFVATQESKLTLSDIQTLLQFQGRRGATIWAEPRSGETVACVERFVSRCRYRGRGSQVRLERLLLRSGRLQPCGMKTQRIVSVPRVEQRTGETRRGRPSRGYQKRRPSERRRSTRDAGAVTV